MKLQQEIHATLCILEVMKLSKEFKFFIYLLQKYATYKSMCVNEILKLWDKSFVHGDEIVTDFIQDMYWLYHTERLENAFADIDHILEYGTPLE